MTESQTRKAYIDKMKSRLDDLDENIGKLEQRGEKVEASIQQEFKEKLAELRQNRDHLQARIGEMRETSEQEWEKLQDQVEHTWKAAKNSFHYFMSHFK